MKFSMPHLRAIVRERMNAVLRDGQTSFLQSVRKLTVITQPTGGNVYVKSAKFDLLNSLITKMHLVHAIEWVAVPCYSLAQTWSNLFRWHHSLANLGYPPNAVQDLISNFGSLSHLKELDLRLKTSPNEIIPDFSFESFSNLRILSVTWAYERRPHPRILSQISRVLVRCPNIERFSFSISQAYHLANNFGSPVTSEELLNALDQLPTSLRLRYLETRGVVVTVNDLKRHIHHFRYLKELRIRFDPSPSAPANIGGILSMLRENRIFLEKISIDTINDSRVFDYMTSYSGIEDLSLKPGHCLDNSPELIERFFSCVLPAQSSSLKRLRIGANFVTRWSKPLSEKYLAAVEQCQLLEYICCWASISLLDVEAGRSGNVVNVTSRESIWSFWYVPSQIGWLQTVMKLPHFQHFKCPPITLMRRTFVCSVTMHDFPDESNVFPDPIVRAHLDGIVDDFRKSSKPFFSIDSSYHNYLTWVYVYIPFDSLRRLSSCAIELSSERRGPNDWISWQVYPNWAMMTGSITINAKEGSPQKPPSCMHSIKYQDLATVRGNESQISRVWC